MKRSTWRSEQWLQYTIADRQVYVSFPFLLLVWVKTQGTLVNPKNRLWMDASPLPWYNRFDCSHIWILKVIWVLLHKTDPLEGWTCVIHRRAFAQVQVYMHSSRMLCLLYIFYMSMWIDMTYIYIYIYTYICMNIICIFIFICRCLDTYCHYTT